MGTHSPHPLLYLGTNQKLIIRILSKVNYTLINSNVNEPLYSIPGHVPNPINMPNTCFFKSRCQKCIGKCEGLYPKEIKITDTHYVSCYLYDKEEK